MLILSCIGRVFVSAVDDIIPTPVFGQPYNLQPLTMVWCKHSKTKAIVDSKDVIIEQLFNQINTMQEKLESHAPAPAYVTSNLTSGSTTPNRHMSMSSVPDRGSMSQLPDRNSMSMQMGQMGHQSPMMQQQNPQMMGAPQHMHGQQAQMGGQFNFM